MHINDDLHMFPDFPNKELLDRQARAELEVLKRQRHEIKAQKKQAGSFEAWHYIHMITVILPSWLKDVEGKLGSHGFCH